MRERREASGAGVVVLEQEPVEQRFLKDARDRLIVAFRVELALVVAAADVEREGHARVALDDRVVELYAAVDQLFWVASPLPVAFPHGRVEERSILGPVDLYVGAAKANQLVHLAAREVDDVGQVGISRRVGVLRLLGVVVSGG